MYQGRVGFTPCFAPCCIIQACNSYAHNDKAVLFIVGLSQGGTSTARKLIPVDVAMRVVPGLLSAVCTRQPPCHHDRPCQPPGEFATAYHSNHAPYCWPQVKLAKQGSITFLNSGSNEPQYLDLTHLGSKHRTGINVKLPSVNTNGAYRLPSGDTLPFWAAVKRVLLKAMQCITYGIIAIGSSALSR